MIPAHNHLGNSVCLSRRQWSVEILTTVVQTPSTGPDRRRSTPDRTRLLLPYPDGRDPYYCGRIHHRPSEKLESQGRNRVGDRRFQEDRESIQFFEKLSTPKNINKKKRRCDWPSEKFTGVLDRVQNFYSTRLLYIGSPIVPLWERGDFDG